MLTVIVLLLALVAIAGVGFMLGGPLVALVLAVVVVVAGGAWLVTAGKARETPGDVARQTETPELLGPGGPDDPDR